MSRVDLVLAVLCCLALAAEAWVPSGIRKYAENKYKATFIKNDEGYIWLSTDTVTDREQARKNCQDIGGYLSVISRDDDTPRYQAVLRKANIKTPISIFIDGSDEGHEGSFTWSRGFEMDVQSVMWAPGQPNGGRTQNCLAMSSEDGLIYDVACSGYKLRYFCHP